MKKLEITKQESKVQYIYEAIDGTKFEDSVECKNYEKTCLCVLNQKYKKYVIYNDSEYNIWNAGSDDYFINFVRVPDQAAIDAIFQMYCYYNTSMTSDYYDKVYNRIKEACELKRTLVIGVGYPNEDSFYVYEDTVESIVEKIQNIVNQ